MHGCETVESSSGIAAQMHTFGILFRCKTRQAAVPGECPVRSPTGSLSWLEERAVNINTGSKGGAEIGPEHDR